jgi:hypothetical protein
VPFQFRRSNFAAGGGDSAGLAYNILECPASRGKTAAGQNIRAMQLQIAVGMSDRMR